MTKGCKSECDKWHATLCYPCYVAWSTNDSHLKIWNKRRERQPGSSATSTGGWGWGWGLRVISTDQPLFDFSCHGKHTGWRHTGICVTGHPCNQSYKHPGCKVPVGWPVWLTLRLTLREKRKEKNTFSLPVLTLRKFKKRYVCGWENFVQS